MFLIQVNTARSCIYETRSKLLHRKKKQKHFKHKYYHKAWLGNINIHDIFHVLTLFFPIACLFVCLFVVVERC